ncbi:MAG: hypothetical protein JRN03_04685 [Nitrososphaerota archaeon]|nr:hypothetical protein [Nitrososphaerota archaeon]
MSASRGGPGLLARLPHPPGTTYQPSPGSLSEMGASGSATLWRQREAGDPRGTSDATLAVRRGLPDQEDGSR